MDGDKYYDSVYGSLTCDKYASVDLSKLILTSTSLGADCKDTDALIWSSGKQYLDMDGDKYYDSTY
jgi:hypothetical protein